MIITCKDRKKLQNFINELSKDFPVTQEDITQIVGIQTQYNQEQGILRMHQQHAIQQILETYEMTECVIAPTPMEDGWHPDIHPNKDTNSDEMNFPIREALGSLGYISNQTRPDITFAVSRISLPT